MDEYYLLLPLSCCYVEFLRHEIVLHFNTLPDIPSNFLSFKVTFGSFDPILRHNGQFPSLYQAAPKDTPLALAMVFLMLHFRWKWLGLAITDGHKGLQFLSDVTGEMDRKKVCVAFMKMMITPLISYIALAR